MNFLQGHLLIATPDLADPNFFRTVVLLVRHSEEGALGVVLNRPTDCRIKEIWEELERPCNADGPVYLGGPCPGPLMAVHMREEFEEDEGAVFPGVYFATQREHLHELVSQPGETFRMFSGYSGWASGQLEGELETGSWLTTPASKGTVFGSDDELWRIVSRQIGEDVLRSALKIKGQPHDPMVN